MPARERVWMEWIIIWKKVCKRVIRVVRVWGLALLLFSHACTNTAHSRLISCPEGEQREWCSWRENYTNCGRGPLCPRRLLPQALCPLPPGSAWDTHILSTKWIPSYFVGCKPRTIEGWGESLSMLGVRKKILRRAIPLVYKKSN